jgi:hypothetical protein
MSQKLLTPAVWLSGLITLLIILASAGGLFLDGLYRDNTWILTQLRGSDLVRLLVSVPTLLLSLYLARRGSLRALLVWLGCLWLAVYDYAFYLFGVVFNEFFLVYAALFALSILALILALPHVDAGEVARRFSPRTPVRLASGYMAFIAAFLSFMWLSRIIGFLSTGQLPEDIVAAGYPFAIVYALDLSVLVPGMLLAAAWLWQRRPWGYVLGAMMLVKAAIYPLVLIGMGVYQAVENVPGAWDMVPFWAFFALASLVVIVLFLGRMQPEPAHRISKELSHAR